MGWFNKKKRDRNNDITEELTSDIQEAEALSAEDAERNGIKITEQENVIRDDDLSPAGTEKTDDGDEAQKEKVGFFGRLRSGLSRTRENLTGKIEKLVKSGRALDEDFFEELEEILIGADVGVETSLELVESLRKKARANKLKETSEVKELLKQSVEEMLSMSSGELAKAAEGPTVILMVGVNGVGKTTTIAKLAHMFKSHGKRVLLAAGDTFRAAAADQLQIWADRAGVELVRHQEGADPAAVVFDALSAARARRADYLIVDTAGRLHTKSNLMQEIAKVRRVIDREIPGAPHECLLVLDATTGQNAIAQARQFKDATGVTGIALTKLDGTAKGGIVIAIARELGIPVKVIGVGEGMNDLRPFVPGDFVEALFGGSED